MASPAPDLSRAVFTLQDLDAWPSAGAWLAVLGHPIKHSISPVLHMAALAEMARTEERFRSWKYVRFDIPPAQLQAALKRFHEKGFLGLNLTVPHKVLAMAEVTQVSSQARAVGATNTLRRVAGGWEGFNTDGFGLEQGLRKDLHAELKNAAVILLGAGGAARGAAVQCLQAGCAALAVGNRTQENLDTLLRHLQPLRGSSELRGFDPLRCAAELPKNAWVINATSSGLNPGDSAPIDLVQLPEPAGVYDMIYNPAETALLAQARALGLPAANGLSMLIHQGARALELWTERPVPVPAMEAAARGCV